MNNLIEVMRRSGECDEVIEESVYIIETHLGLEGFEWLESMLYMVEDVEQVNEIIKTIEEEKLLIEEEQRELSQDEIESIKRMNEEMKIIEDYNKVKKFTSNMKMGF